MEAGIENGYLPDSPEVLVKTAMVGGGETTQITFDLSKFKEDGDYTFAVLSQNDKLNITLANNSHLPSNFINAAWQGYYVTATQRA